MMRRLCARLGLWLLRLARAERLEVRLGEDSPVVLAVYVLDVQRMVVPVLLVGAAYSYAQMNGIPLPSPEDLKQENFNPTRVH